MKTVKFIAAAIAAAVMTVSAADAPVYAQTHSVMTEAASKLPAPKGITKSVSAGAVTLKWKKVSGADAYRVYIYDAAKKKYAAYKDVTALKCTVKGLSAGTHRFRIAALVKKGGKYAVQTRSAAVTVSVKAESAAFTVTSADLKNGVWNTVITHTAGGSDRSPELTWDAVEGAEEYAVYMLDISAKNWLHWRAYGIKSTHLDAGSASEDASESALKNEYKGPYPPSGTHTYVVTVFALKKPADSYPGSFDAKNSGIDDIRSALDISGGVSGNVIASASLSGAYTHGD